MRRLAVVAVAMVVVSAASAWAASRMDLPHRLGHHETIGNAQLNEPGLWQWPHFDHQSAASHCDMCPRAGGEQAIYGLLVSDEDLTNFSSNVPNAPHSPADVPLPRLIWIFEWPDRCRQQPPPGSSWCTSYELVDDATGWFLTGSQLWR